MGSAVSKKPRFGGVGARASATAVMVLALFVPATLAQNGPLPSDNDTNRSTPSVATAAPGTDAPAKAAADPKSGQTPPPLAIPKGPAPKSPLAKKVERWFDLQTLSGQVRYRRIDTSAGVTSTDQAQDGITVKGRLKLDDKGRASVNFLAGTGNGFTSSWNNTGIGTGDRSTTFFLKHLFVAGVPVKGVEASWGGIGMVRGESTEITSWDNDGYMLGTRVTVKRPKDFYFDEISVTNGYLGDVSTSALGLRTSHLTDVNYRHVLVSKRFSPWMAASTDYTWLAGVPTLRAAVSFKTKAARVIDLVRYEEYRRGGADAAYGFSAYAEKNVTKAATLGGGYADVDPLYGGQNADRFNKGARWFGSGSLKLTREFTASFFVTEATNNSYAVANKTRIDVVLVYNALATFQRAGLFK